MKIQAIFAALLLLVSTIAVAQKHNGNPAEQAKAQTEHLQKALNLDAKQADKILAINTKYATYRQQQMLEMKKQKEAGKAFDKAALKEKRDATKAQQEADIKAVLKAEQVTKFNELLAQREAKHAEHGKGEHGKRGEKVAAHLQKELNLDAAQTAKIEAINKKYADKNKENHEAMKTNRKAQMDEIKAILTPEQAKKFEEMKAEKKANHAEKHGKKGERKSED